MNYKKGDILMFQVGSKDASFFELLNYQPYIFDDGKRVLFLVDHRGLKLYKKFKKGVKHEK